MQRTVTHTQVGPTRMEEHQQATAARDIVVNLEWIDLLREKFDRRKEGGGIEEEDGGRLDKGESCLPLETDVKISL